MMPGDEDAQKLSNALSLTDKQVHEEVTYALYRRSHFLISIGSRRVACAALESSILWDRDQTEYLSIKPASSIRHIDIDLEWRKRGGLIRDFVMNLRLIPLLAYICEHVRAFRCLQTPTVRILNSRPMVECANSILEPLEELQADLPGVQIAK